MLIGVADVPRLPRVLPRTARSFEILGTRRLAAPPTFRFGVGIRRVDDRCSARLPFPAVVAAIQGRHEVWIVSGRWTMSILSALRDPCAPFGRDVTGMET